MLAAARPVPQYLARLVIESAAPASARDYARAIRDLAARREIIESAQAAIEQARDVPVDVKPSEIAADAIAALQTIAETASDTQTRLEPADAANA
jgi:replicative DNA helicase